MTSRVSKHVSVPWSDSGQGYHHIQIVNTNVVEHQNRVTVDHARLRTTLMPSTGVDILNSNPIQLLGVQHALNYIQSFCAADEIIYQWYPLAPLTVSSSSRVSLYKS